MVQYSVKCHQSSLEHLGREHNEGVVGTRQQGDPTEEGQVQYWEGLTREGLTTWLKEIKVKGGHALQVPL